VQIGGKGGANAFVINSRVAWSQSRDKLHLASFNARIIADMAEQQAVDDVPLRRVPVLMPGDLQLPTGPGEPPPSQPSIPGLEPDLPALSEQSELEQRGQQRLLE
jgi:hypothetical protein